MLKEASSTEVAFALLTQPSRLRISTLPEFRSDFLAYSSFGLRKLKQIFQFEEFFGQKINFDVFDHDTTNGDDFLGRKSFDMVRTNDGVFCSFTANENNASLKATTTVIC